MCLKYFYNEQHACPKPFICNMIVSNNKIKIKNKKLQT